MPEVPEQAVMSPLDEHNLELLAQVRPSGYRNPVPKDRYHLVVVGAGTAGLVTAAGAAGLGARVALVERHMMGGDCLNVGCVPSKAVIRSARAWQGVREASRYGAPQAEGDGDFAHVMKRMREIRAQISQVDGVERFRELGVDVFLGHGAFTGPGTLSVDNRELRFRRAVIATGARPAAPDVPGLAEAGYLTNETVFWLEKRPRRLLVVGAGPIGCELAQAFARLGSEVTVIDLAERILPREDAAAAAVVQAAMERDGVRYLPGTELTSVSSGASSERVVRYRRGGVAGSESELRADEILIGIGRRPNLENLGLAAAGVEHGPRGVRVDGRLRTTNSRIFAAGDVASAYKFTHAADAQARIVIQNALFFGRLRASRLVIPWCTYTSPEIAHVGLQEREAETLGIALDSILVPLAEVDRAILDGETEGFLRIHLKQGTDRILGATLVAAHAGDMIAELVLAITHGIGLAKIGTTIHPYPTQGEVSRKAADAWRRRKLTPRVRKLFAAYFRVLR